MKLGDSFIWAPDLRRSPHLYFAVTDPAKNGGQFVIFNLTSSKTIRKGDHILMLKVGDHPFIKNDSEINFGDGVIVNVTKIQALIAKQLAFVQPPLDRRHVERIARIARSHPAVSREIQKMIAAEWNF